MKYIVTVNDKNYEVEVERGEARVLSIAAATPVFAAAMPAVPAVAPLPVATPTLVKAVPDGQGGTPLNAPMPGTILSILKNPGDRVKKGDVVIILEAMKMENEIVAMTDGTISQIVVSKGTAVTTGDLLVLIA
jgi:glutaconyl-CoA/methylmalonyl-CoA decarboxylase subunit gamma